MGLNIKLKIIEVLEENLGENPCDLESGKDFLDTPKAQFIREKNA